MKKKISFQGEKSTFSLLSTHFEHFKNPLQGKTPNLKSSETGLEIFQWLCQETRNLETLFNFKLKKVSVPPDI